MNLLNPLALLFSLLAGPIILLYMLRLRRRQVPVSSNMLWQMLLRDREANAPWQKLRRNLLLLLQLLVLAALAVALARPYLPVPTVAAGAVAVLIDASVSMRATDVSPSRFEVAQEVARDIVNGLPSGGRMTLIRAADPPEILAAGESDRDTLRRAISDARPSEGPADWQAAFALAAGAVGADDSSDAAVVVISDGGLPESGLPALPADVRFVPIGSGSDNIAISALSLRASENGTQLFARVTNHGDAPRVAILSIYIEEGLYSAQEVTVTPDEPFTLVLEGLPEGATVYRAELSSPNADAALDVLVEDNTAFAVYQPPVTGRTLLVSPGNLFLEQLLAAMPGLEPYRAPADGPLPAEPFDLYVFDGALPDILPDQDLLVINPPNNELFAVEGEFTDTGGARVADHPLTQNVDWSAVHVLRAKAVAPPDWAHVLIHAEGGALALAGETGGRRVAVLTFDLHDSDLPLQVAFPILFANLINYLAPAREFSAPDGLRPGQALEIRPEADVERITIGYPDGSFQTMEVSEAGVAFTDTHQLGLYAVNDHAGDQVKPARYFAVNLFEPAESDIRPRGSITVGRAEVSNSSRQAVGQREFWPWLGATALAVLLLEWWVYHHGSSLPAVPGWRGWLRRKRVAGGA